MKDKVVLITGGSQGYGKATAKLFADHGAKVIIAARTQSVLKRAMEETCSHSYICMDVTKPDNWDKAYNHIMREYGRLDVLVNNAGAAVKVTDLTDQSVENIDTIIALNLNSIIYGSRAFASLMKQQKSGTIINVSSACAKHAWPGWSVYAAAKWGILGFSKNIYVELQPYNVRVTCLIPGAGATDFMKHSGGINLEMKLKPEDIAQTIYNVCSLPRHVVVEEMTVWGNDQVVVPL